MCFHRWEEAAEDGGDEEVEAVEDSEEAAEEEEGSGAEDPSEARESGDIFIAKWNFEVRENFVTTKK